MEQRSSATGGELFTNKQLGLRLRAKVVLGGESAVVECQLTVDDGELIAKFSKSAEVRVWISVMVLDGGIANGNVLSN